MKIKVARRHQIMITEGICKKAKISVGIESYETQRPNPAPSQMTTPPPSNKTSN
jgi:hypothetical protein